MMEDILPTADLKKMDESHPPDAQAKPLNIVLRTLKPSQTPHIDAMFLSEAEQDRAKRFMFDEDRWSYQAAHALLRAMLSEFHGLKPRDWQFSKDSFGRPEIDEKAHPNANIRFNISHTHGMAACAMNIGSLNQAIEIGVDAENMNREVSFQMLADRYFSKHEAQWLRSLPHRDLGPDFLRLWTLKEAIAKATGLGLSLDFQSFHCTIAPLSVYFDSADFGPSEAWHLNRLDLEPCHSISLAVKRPAHIPIKLEIQQRTDL